MWIGELLTARQNFHSIFEVVIFSTRTETSEHVKSRYYYYYDIRLLFQFPAHNLRQLYVKIQTRIEWTHLKNLWRESIFLLPNSKIYKINNSSVLWTVCLYLLIPFILRLGPAEHWDAFAAALKSLICMSHKWFRWCLNAADAIDSSLFLKSLIFTRIWSFAWRKQKIHEIPICTAHCTHIYREYYYTMERERESGYWWKS